MINVNQYGQLRPMGQPDSPKINPKILTPALCRAARGFLDWTQSDLADQSGVSRSTIRDYEGDRHDIHRATEAQLRLAFERAGVDFIRSESDAIGICPGRQQPN
jgi:transcriptional regulator with XRE-family HTH domain